MILIALLAALLAAGPSTEPNHDWTTNDLGQLIFRPFKSAPYPHPSRANGYKGSATTYPVAGHYDDSTVAIFIPRNFVQRDTVNYVVHFHGHANHISKVVPQYKLPEQLVESNVNAILIVPQGPKDAADSGCGKLELDKNGLKNLLDEVTTFLNEEGKIHTRQIGHVAISAHSGGYKVAAAVLDHGGLPDQITDVLLLDASYGNLEQFSAWCDASSNHRLVSLFTDHLAPENKTLMDLLAKSKVKFDLLDEPALKDEMFLPRRPLFMHTSLKHNDVPMQNHYFARLLKTSALAN